MSEVYRGHARQREFHADPRPWRWLAAGYGTGKTTAVAMEALSLAVNRHPGYSGIVAAPTYALLWQSWVAVWERIVPRALWRISRDPLTGPRLMVSCPDGQTSTVYLRSTDNPWSNEGINAAWLVFDEATRERDRAAWDVLVARVRRGHPGRQLAALLSGPPTTRTHWTAQEFGCGPGDGREGTADHWHTSTHAVVRARTRDNPHLPEGYEAALRSRPGVSRAWCSQWLDAEFGAADGQIYAAFTRTRHVVPAASLAGRRWRRVVVGVDWGWTHPGVMLVVAQDGLGDLYVLREEVHRERIVADTQGGWVPLARSLDAAYSPDGWACDPSLPGNLASLHRGGIRGRVYGAENDVAEGLRVVSAHLEHALARVVGEPLRGPPALYVSDACTHLIGELEGYSRKRLRDGSLSEQPREIDDDACDALRYAVMALADRRIA